MSDRVWMERGERAAREDLATYHAHPERYDAPVWEQLNRNEVLRRCGVRGFADFDVQAAFVAGESLAGAQNAAYEGYAHVMSLARNLQFLANHRTETAVHTALPDADDEEVAEIVTMLRRAGGSHERWQFPRGGRVFTARFVELRHPDFDGRAFAVGSITG